MYFSLSERYEIFRNGTYESVWKIFNLVCYKLKSRVDLKNRIESRGTKSMCFTAGRWNGKTDLSGPRQSFSRGVSHIDASTISSRGGALAGAPRGSRYPPTLQTSLQIVIRPIVGPHINRDPNEGQESGRTCARVYVCVCVCARRACTIGAYCEHRITCARIKSFALQRSRKLIPIGRRSRLS